MGRVAPAGTTAGKLNSDEAVNSAVLVVTANPVMLTWFMVELVKLTDFLSSRPSAVPPNWSGEGMALMAATVAWPETAASEVWAPVTEADTVAERRPSLVGLKATAARKVPPGGSVAGRVPT